MADMLDALVGLLSLERLEENLFRGQSQDLGWGVVFGGQVLGQALAAAVHTVVADRAVHSLHAYFLRPGDVAKPIIYDVDRIRDGGSFTTRRVVAIQNGQAIFNLAASFQKPEVGVEHQDAMPPVPAPESAATEQERLAPFAGRLPAALRNRALGPRPFEHRPVEETDDLFKPSPRPARRQVWFRATRPLPDEPALHAYLLAYASDHGFVSTALLPHGLTWLSPGMQLASLDHVMWFHRPFRIDQWLLYVIDSPAAAGGRGLVRGQVFTQNGLLVASTAQEGLMRQHPIPH